MKILMTTPLMLLLTLLWAMPVIAAIPTEAQNSQYMSINVDRVVIDTGGLARVSAQMAGSIDRLAAALDRLSTGGEALSDEEKRVLLEAVASVDQASAALTRLADELPRTAQRLSRQLPQVIENARQPIAELSGGLQSARDGIYAITQSLPQATASAKDLVDSSIDSAMVRISTYTVILIAVLAFALIGVAWFIYRQYLAPIAARLEPLAVAPEHFAALSRHMKETSDNLLALRQAGELVSRDPGSTEAPPRNGDPG